MEKNRIYFFTGTGNSLKVAKDIANILEDCELVAIHKDVDTEIPTGCERIGIVFPNYSGGPPSLVADFIRNMKMPKQSKPYLFAIATYGGNAGELIALVAKQFDESGLQLDYGAQIWSYPNWLIPNRIVSGLISRRTIKRTESVVKDVVHEQHMPIPKLKSSSQMRYDKFMNPIHDGDHNYSINSNCISCGICKNVCPAKNISLEIGQPSFQHDCEGCMACINYCPRHAINYKGKNQSRRRYTHPKIDSKMLSQYYR
jgi:ferredoxin/flavodoxin